ncbi:hypothetical protein DL546_002645 [Coniochaeta pulveracea]|uniref:Thiol-specific monooxygenase n=1 Tax=Coniochaeta pulveracea TaxID=177199 RepID=A0A420Y241_9PEZI|nr:hypothetical protein DL546_002645 [Coniochaeta pulveracea]
MAGEYLTDTVIREQTEVGGVWNYCEKPSPTLRVPQVSAFVPPDPPVQRSPTVFSTPMYDVLHTNIPWPLMKYSDQDFPKDSLIFPSRQAVQDYLVDYSRDIRHLIRFSTLVRDIRLRQEEGRDQWDVVSESTETRERRTNTYDAVVVASGHYSTPYIPEVMNIREFHEAHPEVISHSKSYRSPEHFKNKKVVVVGNSASGLDIASQISKVCQKPLLLSVHTPSPPENLEWAGAEEVPVIDEFLVAERGVQFADGRIERDLDAILYATGYLFTFPFLTSLEPPLVSDGRRVHGLYKHLIHIQHPTLVFPGLPIKVVPFPLAESQAAVFSRVWANALPLPSREEMKIWEEEEAQRRGPAYHIWPKGGDAEYINATHKVIVESKTSGKEPPLWNDELLWQRKVYAEAKLKFEKEGWTAKSLEELGYHYRPAAGEPSKQEIL